MIPWRHSEDAIMFKLFRSRQSRETTVTPATALDDHEIDKARGGIIAILIGLTKSDRPEQTTAFSSNHSGGANFR
jgi:hypothetical protein